MKDNKYYQMNAIKLAYIGDAVFSLYMREYFINNSLNKNGAINKHVNAIVCAKYQSQMMDVIISKLNEEEIDIVTRARNAHINNKAKNSSLAEYSSATQFEALIGYWYLTKQKDKLDSILKMSVDNAEIK